MRNRKPNARAAAKDATHERIVAVAARAIRRSGYDGTGVADIMKEAGLTNHRANQRATTLNPPAVSDRPNSGSFASALTSDEKACSD